jgi:hypothetical protein
MKLINFDLERPFVAISLKGLGHEWDLHNFADFLGLRFDAADNSLSMTWDASSHEGNPWGEPENTAKGCQLIFCNVTFLQMSGRDNEIPLSEDLCLSSVSKVIPNTTEYRCRDDWGEGEEFNLLFEFHSERSLEIGAESVELQSVV